MKGDTKGYPLEKFIHGIVARIISSYKMTDLVYEATSGKMDSDFRKDLIQVAWVAALKCQKSHPKESRNPHYLRRAVVNALIKTEQKDRPRRDFTDDIEENTVSVELKNDLNSYDTQLLLDKANLTPSQRVVIELIYGMTSAGECSLHTAAIRLGKSDPWVQSRLTAAMIKLQVAAGR